MDISSLAARYPVATRMTAVALVLMPLAFFDVGRLIDRYPFLVPAFFFAAASAVYVSPDFFRAEGPVVAFAAGWIAYTFAPHSIEELRFYALAAQVVPVLFLTLAIESRALRLQARSTASFTTIITFSMAFAEFDSLRVVVLADASRASFNVVAGALSASAVLILLFGFLGVKEGADVGGS